MNRRAIAVAVLTPLGIFSQTITQEISTSTATIQLPSTQQPLVKAATHLVVVNAVVTDREGNAVIDLTKDDFKIVDGQSPQKIGFFTAVQRRIEPEVTTSPPGTYANSAGPAGADQNATALVFDTLYSHWSSQGMSLQRVRSFLRHLLPDDHIAIYVLGDDLRVVHHLDHDSTDILAAINAYDQRHKGEQNKAGSTGLPELDRLLTGRSNRFRPELEESVVGSLDGRSLHGLAYQRAMLEEDLRVSMISLQTIARHLASAPGRKSLVWVSDAIPGVLLAQNPLAAAQEIGILTSRQSRAGGTSTKHQETATNQPDGNASSIRDDRHESGLTAGDLMKMMARLFTEKGIAVYPVSAEGLQTWDLGFRSPSTNGQSHDPGQTIAKSEHAANTENHQFMEELAQRTGGRAYYNRNDLETGIRRALDDSRYTYELAYYPDHNDWKGEWRNIQVKVTRPGLKVLARGGYFAFPDPRPLPPKAREQFLTQIAASPLESTELPFTVRVTASLNQLEASVHLNPQPMLLNQADGRWKGSFELVFFQLDGKNKILDVTTKTADLDVKPATYQQLVEKGVDVPAKLAYRSGASLLSVVLHDRNSDAVGSIRIPLAQYAAALQSSATAR